MSLALEADARPSNQFFVWLFTVLRSGSGKVIGVPWTLVFCIVCTITGALGFQKVTTNLMHLWARGVLWIFGIRVEVRGEENLPLSGGGIAVFNHQSHFDIPTLMASTHKPIRFGAKIELFKIPLFGRAMRAVGTLPIARDNRSQVMRIYKEAEARFADGFVFVLAPEGTRQTEPAIGRFKKGPFIFAVNGQVPIIPVVISGAHAVLRKRSLSVNVGRMSRTILVEYLPIVPTAQLTMEDVDRLSGEIRARMVEAYGKA